MGIPSAPDAAIYDVATQLDVRLAFSVKRPMWTAEVSDTFGSGSNPDLSIWAYQQLGSGVEVTGGNANIRHKGGPLYDWMITRPGVFPEDPAQPFKMELICTFPQTDPIYSPIIIAGSIDADLSNLHEPFVLWQQGSATGASTFLGATTDGNEKIFTFGSTPYNAAGDQASHTYLVEWDPALAVNADKLTIRRDAGVVATVNSTITRPAYLAIGWVWDRQKNRKTGASIDDLGASVANVIQVHSFKTTQLGAEGYETQVWPGWTIANAGGTDITDSVERERFEEDGETFAIAPKEFMKGATVTQYKNSDHDTIELQLAIQDPDTEATENAFQDDHWGGRLLLFDARVANDAGTFVDWDRQIAARITADELEDGLDTATLHLSGRSIPTDKMDVFYQRSFRGEANSVNAVDVSVSLQTVLTTLIEIADKVSGGVLGAMDKDVTAALLVPQDLGSGGSTVLSALGSIVDRTAHDWWREYTTSGTGRYGEVHIHAPTFGSGTGGYTFRGTGATGNGGEYIRLRLRNDRLSAPGMVHYRQNNPMMPSVNLTNNVGLPTVGRWPAWPYPPTARILNDSLGTARDISATAILQYTDKDAGTINGGTARVRYIKEAARARALSLDVPMAIWAEPNDEFDVDAPNRPGLSSSESWVIDGVTKNFMLAGEDLVIVSIDAYTSDWTSAIERGLFV